MSCCLSEALEGWFEVPWPCVQQQYFRQYMLRILPLFLLSLCSPACIQSQFNYSSDLQSVIQGCCQTIKKHNNWHSAELDRARNQYFNIVTGDNSNFCLAEVQSLYESLSLSTFFFLSCLNWPISLHFTYVRTVHLTAHCWALMPNAASRLLHQDITLTCGHLVTKVIPYSSFSQRIMSAVDGRGESNTDLLFKPQSLECQVMKQVKAFNYLRTKICCSLSFTQTADTVWKKSQHGQ